MAKLKDTKPKKPYPSFTLTAHPNGQWCKKIRGKVHFFGTWADPQAALDRYHVLADDLHSGRQPRISTLASGGITVKQACNAYLNWQREKADAGEIQARWFEECVDLAVAFGRSVGEGRLISDLRPEEFQRYRMKLAKQLSPVSLIKRITMIKSIFRYAYETDLIREQVRFGKGFNRPSAAQQRKAKRRKDLEAGKRLFTAQQILQLLADCPAWMKGAILLGINGGFGNSDCATLPIKAVDLERGLIEYDRPKTGVERLVPLWPETIEALRQVINGPRPTPFDRANASLVFLSASGKPLVRDVTKSEQETGFAQKFTHFDDLSDEFAALAKKLGIHRNGLGFYALRHTFRTWADEIHDQHAIHRIMGHAIPGMSGVYVEAISLDRLQKVTDHVHTKLYGDLSNQHQAK